MSRRAATGGIGRALALLGALAAASSAAAVSGVNDFGVRGLIDVPSARMARDGTLTTTYARQDLADIYALTYQVTPWLETSFRYTIFNPRNEPGSTDELFDRSFEVKAGLWKEGRWRPQVAVGVRDLLGTGVWAGEYVVASKLIGPVDVTLGMGWGRLAERSAFKNPLRGLSSQFERRSDVRRETGDFSPGNYFSGRDVGLFGGFRYPLPRWNAALVAEYNSDAYEREQAHGSIDDPSPYSVGVEWSPVRDVTLGVSWQQGDQVALRVSTGVPTKFTPPPRAPQGFSAARRRGPAPRIAASGDRWYDHLVDAAAVSGVFVRSADPMGDDALNIVYSNGDYQIETDAIRRVLELAEFYAPQQYRTLVLTGYDAGGATHSTRYKRRGPTRWSEAAFGAPVVRRHPKYESDYRYPRLFLSGNLGLQPYIFDPDAPFLYEVFARANVDLDFGHHWVLTGSWVQNLYNDFDEIQRTSNSVLPHVRSDAAQYLEQGETGIDRLAFTKRGTLAPNVHYHAFAGILEQMYAGAGAEVLYRPFGSRFAVGIDAIGVKQRDFDRGFGFRDYETVIGHLSGYWASPLYNLDFAVHAGRYLAKDWGGTFEVTRRFANGWSVGLFATFTDVPFDKFGEGSFDKGLVLRIPLNSLFEVNTQSAYRTVIRPIQRDGGQRLPAWGSSLWDTLRRSHVDRLDAQRNRMWP